MIPGDRKGKGVQESHLSWCQSIPSGPGVALIWAIGLKVRKDGSCCDLKASELETQTLRSGQEWNQAIGRLEPRSKKIVKANRDLVAKALERH